MHKQLVGVSNPLAITCLVRQTFYKMWFTSLPSYSWGKPYEPT